MAYFARSDAVRAERARRESMRRVRTTRPRRGGIATVAFRLEGAINADRRFGRYLFLIDPRNEAVRPEFKVILGFDGMLDAGELTVAWIHSALGAITWIEGGAVVSDHVITPGGNNRVWLDTPVILENGEWLRPEISVGPPAGTMDVTADAMFEHTAI